LNYFEIKFQFYIKYREQLKKFPQPRFATRNFCFKIGKRNPQLRATLIESRAGVCAFCGSVSDLFQILAPVRVLGFQNLGSDSYAWVPGMA